jgi:pimeloyl-ACP methyl ester carboxylesterase
LTHRTPPSDQQVMLIRLLLSTLVALSVVGCARLQPMTSAQLDRGYILMLPGVANNPWSMVDLACGLRDDGIDHAIQQDLWGDRPFGDLKNLCALELNRKRAAERAATLAAYRKDHPRQPITIIGYSGGGAIALFICEAMPKEMKIDRVILLGAAVSPGYDLAPAMEHCRHGIVNFYSEGDWFDAGVLTGFFGTMDRKKTPTAGKLGFLDANGELAARSGLTQIAWTPAWRRLGHTGGHFGWGSRAWARQVLAPLIRADAAASSPSAGDVQAKNARVDASGRYPGATTALPETAPAVGRSDAAGP